MTMTYSEQQAIDKALELGFVSLNIIRALDQDQSTVLYDSFTSMDDKIAFTRINDFIQYEKGLLDFWADKVIPADLQPTIDKLKAIYSNL